MRNFLMITLGVVGTTRGVERVRDVIAKLTFYTTRWTQEENVQISTVVANTGLIEYGIILTFNVFRREAYSRAGNL